MRRDPRLEIPRRHLGLVQASESSKLDELLNAAAERVDADVDLDALLALARPPTPPDDEIPDSPDSPDTPLPPLGQRIAVAQDEAFGFGYPHLLEGWRDAGAELMPFSPLADDAPDSRADAIFLPGGYPELHAERLANATEWKQGIRRAAENDVLVYGECGGYMALGKQITDAQGRSHLMCGALNATFDFRRPTRTLGYRRLRHDGALPFPRRLRGHEFRYSSLEERGERGERGDGDAPLFVAHDAADAPLGAIGARRGRVMGSYAHVISRDEDDSP